MDLSCHVCKTSGRLERSAFGTVIYLTSSIYCMLKAARALSDIALTGILPVPSVAILLLIQLALSILLIVCCACAVRPWQYHLLAILTWLHLYLGHQQSSMPDDRALLIRILVLLPFTWSMATALEGTLFAWLRPISVNRNILTSQTQLGLPYLPQGEVGIASPIGSQHGISQCKV